MGSLTYEIVLSENVTFYFFLSSFNAFISFVLIALFRTSNTILNKSGKTGHPCLVPELRGKPPSFLSLSMILAGGFSHMALISWGMFPLHVWEFLSSMGGEFCHMLFLPLLRWPYDGSPSFCFGDVSHRLNCGFWAIPRIPLPHGAWWCWHMLEFSLLVFCWWFLHLCSPGVLAYSFVFLWHPCLVLMSEQCWPPQMSLGVFPPLYFLA